MSAADKEFSYRKSLKFDFHEIDKKLGREIPLKLTGQIDKVLSVLRKAIEKAKISLILPQILENTAVLKLHVENTKYKNCLKLVQEYRNKRESESRQGNNCNDFDEMKIIDYFQENYKIIEVLPNWLDDIDNTEKRLLAALEDIYQLARKRMQMPATADLAKEKRLHEIYLANEDVREQIKETQHRLESSKINRLWKMAAESGAIKKLEDELAFMQYDNNMLVKREKVATLRQIQHINNVLVNKQQELEENLRKAGLTYEAELRTNLIQEKNLSSERRKLENHLLAMTKKYDETICEKRKEEIQWQTEYDEQKKEFDALLILHKRKEAHFREKLSEYQRRCETKIVLFTHTCAAKKIQRWWKTGQKKRTRARKIKDKGKHNSVLSKNSDIRLDHKEVVKKSGGQRKKKTKYT